LWSTIVPAQKLLYRSTFNSSDALARWVAEGPLNATISNNTLDLRGAGGPDDYFVYWLPEVLPDRIRITWEFTPIQEPGLAMFFFGAQDTGPVIRDGRIAFRQMQPLIARYRNLEVWSL
ncbi:concanavalin A-like lectin/glucanase, partial [Setomelanomma holmii]